MVSVGDVIFSVSPLAVLIGLLVKKNPWPSSVALPASAGLIWLIRLAYFAMDPLLAAAEILVGFVTALTPLTIVFCAITFFRVLEFTGCLDSIKEFLNDIAPNLLVQTMLVAWNFSFLLEGIAGFGTPAALSAPLLAAAGVRPLRAGACALIMNSVPVSFGAVGTPVWFGFSQLGLSDEDFVSIGWRAAVLSLLPAHIAPLLALRLVVPWAEIRRHIVFVVLCIWASVLPFLGFAFVSAEFPSLVGGFVGLLLAGLIAKFNIGVPQQDAADASPRDVGPERGPDPETGQCVDGAPAEGGRAGGGATASERSGALDLGGGMSRQHGPTCGAATADHREQGDHGHAAAPDAPGEGGVELGEVTQPDLDGDAAGNISADDTSARGGGGDAPGDGDVGGDSTVPFASPNAVAQGSGGGGDEAESNAEAHAAAASFGAGDAGPGPSGYGPEEERTAEAAFGHADGTGEPGGAATPTPAGGGEVKEGELGDVHRGDPSAVERAAKGPGAGTDADVPHPSPLGSSRPQAQDDTGGAHGAGHMRPLPPAGWALAPIASVVVLLLVTRVIDPVRQWLGDTEPGFTVSLRSLGDVAVSSSIVIAWRNVLRSGRTLADGTKTEAANADYKALLTPAFMPFIVVGVATVLAFRQPLGCRCWPKRLRGLWCSGRGERCLAPTRSPRGSGGSSSTLAASPRTVEATERHEAPSPRHQGGDQSFRDCVVGAWHRVFPHAVVALLFSLVFVRLLLSGGARAPATLLGKFLSDVFGSWFGLVAPLVGALGSFFSGSATVSNLTFGGIQRTAAQAGGLDVTWVLALQTAGSAFGNQVCIGNILAVASILGLLDDNRPAAPGSDTTASPEGGILRMTTTPCLASVLALAVQGVLVA